MRVEAASYGGRPVSFSGSVRGRSERDASTRRSAAGAGAFDFRGCSFSSCVLGGASSPAATCSPAGATGGGRCARRGHLLLQVRHVDSRRPPRAIADEGWLLIDGFLQRRRDGARVLDPLHRARALRAPPLARDADFLDAGALGELARSARGPRHPYRAAVGTAAGLSWADAGSASDRARHPRAGATSSARGAGQPRRRRGVGSFLGGAVGILGPRHRVSSSFCARVWCAPAGSPGLVVTLLSAATSRRGSAVELPVAVLIHGHSSSRHDPLRSPRARSLETCRRSSATCIYSSDPSSWDFYAGMIAVA